MAQPKQWTAKRQSALEKWLTLAKKHMALEDWTISVDWEGNELTNHLTGEAPSALATMTPMPCSKHAVMTVSQKLLELDPQLRHQTLVHELVHCHLFALHEFAQASFDEVAKKNKLARKVHRKALTQHVETATDALADAFAELIPEAHVD